MIRNSVIIMTVIDSVVICITLVALWNFYRNRRLLRHLNLFSGAVLTLSGLVFIASFYIADILIMHILPMFAPLSEVMAAMTTLHLDYNWITSTAGISLIVLSVMRFNRVLFPKIVQMENDLHKRASTDSLTNAYNRSKFEEIITKEADRARRYDQMLCLVIFDIDNFKKINDTHGHLFGDYVLKKIVDLTRDNIRGIDYLVRWGGEEFMIILPETGLDRAEALSERIRKTIESFRFNNNGRVTVSLGVARFEKGDTKEAFIERADDALYKAKNNGRNRVEISPDR